MKALYMITEVHALLEIFNCYMLQAWFKNIAVYSMYVILQPIDVRVIQKLIVSEAPATTTMYKFNDNMWHIKHKVTLYGVKR